MKPRRGTPGDGSSATAVLAVDRLAAGGDGVGRIGAKVCFVPLAAPGDRLEVVILEDRRTWCRARIHRVLERGAARVSPACPLFGDCGGCDWQHLAYPAQLAAKRTIVEDALRRIGRLEPPAIAPTLPSPLELGYRHRARLHAARDGAGTAFGFFRRGSHEVVPIASCPVLHPTLNAALAALGESAGRHPRAFAGCADARLDTGWGGGPVRLLFHGGRGAPLAPPEAVAEDLRQGAAARRVRLLLGAGTSEPLALGPGDGALITTGEAFTQVNLPQNARLVESALDLAAPLPGEETLDLYCGLGNLSLPAAARGARVTGVDLDGVAIDQARENARRLRREATFVRGDAAAAARSLSGAGRRFPLVLLNPPRAGAREAAQALAALSPERIVAVSCDPATLARDAAALAARGYALDAVRPVDLFPQTAHVETVARFRRTG